MNNAVCKYISCPHFKAQPVNSNYGNNPSSFAESPGTHERTVWANAEFLRVKACGTYSNECCLKE